MQEIKARPPGTATTTRATSTDDSDVTLTVGTGKIRRYKMIAAQINCTATVGNRQLTVAVVPSGGGQAFCWITANIAASQVGLVALYPGLPYSTTARAGVITSPSINANVVVYDSLPELYLPAGWAIRLYDKNAVDAAADDLYYTISYEEWDV